MKHDDKRITDLINKLMHADNLESAPIGFTDNVMAKIEALSQSKSTIYKPLIPSSVWWLLGIGFIALVTYVLFNKPTTNESFIDHYNLPEVSMNFLEGMSLDLSSSLMYAMVFFAVMISIQIPLLKQYFNKRLAY